jgi:hypothetical protein
METNAHNNRRMVFLMWSVLRNYLEITIKLTSSICTLDKRPSIFIREKPISRQRGCNIRTDCKGSVEEKEKFLIMSLKGLDAKMNCLVVNHQS